ncbi:MAG: hypothetical protein GQ574_12345 [Crocinitomix sp.]|nr:hypothetical protein [Crocinitomix sp.]
MHSLFKKGFEISDSFKLNTIVSVAELSDHDMIYIYHHLKVGSMVQLKAAGTNVKGDLRYQVSYKDFVLGFVTLGETVRSIYENCETIESKIVGLQKQKFLPINGIDISLQATKMRMVS